MKLNVKTYSQRDSRWGSIILGYNTNPIYTLYNWACLITSFGNYVDKTPAEMNQVLKDNGGFTAGSGNFIWSKCTLVGLNQVYISARCEKIDFYSTELQKAKDLIKQGYPLLAEVDFNPATDSAEMHFVLLAGVSDNNELMVVDPWEGQWETWSDGAAKRNIYQFRQYDKKCLEGVASDTIPVLKTDFERLVANSTTRDEIRNKLNCSDNNTIILAEVGKLIDIQGSVEAKDKVIEAAQAKVSTLEEKVKQLTEDHNQFALASTKTIQDQDREITSLQGAVQELKKDCKPQPVFKGWKKKLYDLLLK